MIFTASEPGGPNGPLMPEIEEYAPHGVYVPRRGEVNAWDNAEFVKTVRATGKKTLIMAGVWTSVCVMFPALDAKAAGFNVYAVLDASGDPSKMASRISLARFVQAGVIPTSANAVLCEVQRTWNRADALEQAEIYTMVAPNYLTVVQGYRKAQEVAKSGGREEGRRMKPYLVSLAVGLLVGAIYGFLNVRSPAPPVIALVGLLGILIGEQIAPLVRQIVARERVTATWLKTECGEHIFGDLPGARRVETVDSAARSRES